MINNKGIAKKNDQLRKSFSCKVYLTQSVAYSNLRDQILEAVKQFNQFTSGSEPYGEHDFGAFDLDGVRYFWKFDYFDSNYEFFQVDGNRVLTIGRLYEY